MTERRDARWPPNFNASKSAIADNKTNATENDLAVRIGPLLYPPTQIKDDYGSLPKNVRQVSNLGYAGQAAEWDLHELLSRYVVC